MTGIVEISPMPFPYPSFIPDPRQKPSDFLKPRLRHKRYANKFPAHKELGRRAATIARTQTMQCLIVHDIDR